MLGLLFKKGFQPHALVTGEGTVAKVARCKVGVTGDGRLPLRVALD